MRIVLDTNVVVSALLWRGTPYHLLDAIRVREDAEIFTSATLLRELTEVLLRPVPVKRLDLIGRSAPDVVTDYIDLVELVVPLATPRSLLTTLTTIMSLRPRLPLRRTSSCLATGTF